jgi:DNA-binding CsgD family transcriptional regulator
MMSPRERRKIVAAEHKNTLQVLTAKFWGSGYWQVSLVTTFTLFYTLDLGNANLRLPEEAFADGILAVLWVVASRPTLLFVILGILFVAVRRRQTAFVAAGLLFVGIATFFATTFFSNAEIALLPLLASQMLLAAGVATGLSVFMGSLAKLPMEHALRLLILSFCIGTLVRFVISISKSTTLFWLTACCAFVLTVAALLLMPCDVDDKTNAAIHSAAPHLTQIKTFVTPIIKDYWQPLVCAAFVYFVNALASPLFPVALDLGLDFVLLHSLGLFIGSITLWFAWKRLNILFVSDNLLLGLALFLVVAFLPLPLIGQAYIPALSLAISIPQAALMTTLFAICVEVVKERAHQHVAITCLILFFMDLIMVPATAVGIAIRTAFENHFPMLALISVAFTSIAAFTCLLAKKSRIEKDKQEQTLPAIVMGYSEESIRKNPALIKRHKLSNRELDVLVLLLGAHKTSKVAEALFISENTVKAHKKRLYQKLGVHTRQELLDLVSCICQDEASRE